MNPAARILAAIDRSPHARRAAHRAARIAADCGARLDLLHVLNQGALDELKAYLGLDAGNVEQHLRDAAAAHLEAVVGEVAAASGVPATRHLLAGSVLSTLLERADAVAATLIVVGARGENKVRALLLGTTAERLIRKARRPMLVVRAEVREAYHRVLVPVDFSPWSAPTARLAARLAPGAEIVLLHAFELPFEGQLRHAGVDPATIAEYQARARHESLLRLDGFAAELGLTVRSLRLAEHGHAARTILEQAGRLGCDLIALGKHGRGAMEELLLGSTTKHVLAEAAGDVLVCCD